MLFSGTVLLFFRTTDYGFTNYDDPTYVVDNAQVQAGFTRDSILWAFTAAEANWHPLTWCSHMLDWQLYGASAGGHHLTGVLWHALNAVLAFLLLRRLTGGFWMSAFAAALFAWHPLRVESVAWISERKDVMSGCFFLLTLWAYLAYGERRRQQLRARYFYWLALFSFLCGLMCKPMLVTVPLVLLILDFWPLQRGRLEPGDAIGGKTAGWWQSWREPLLEKIPFFALSLIISVVTVRLQHVNEAFRLDLPFTARLLNALVSVLRYLGKFFWPFDLSVCYPHPGYWPIGVVLASVLLVTGCTVGAWRQRQIRPWLLAGWAWFLVVLLPVSGLVQVGFQAMADRYSYLSLLGWQLAFFGLAGEWSARPVWRRILPALGAVWLVGCAVRTWDQQATWRDPLTLFGHAAAVTDKNDWAEASIAYTHLGLGHFDEAAAHARRALEINPKNESALYSLASVLARRNQLAEAAALCRSVLQRNSQEARTEYLLGTILLHQGQTDEATARLKSAVGKLADLYETNLRMAMAENMQGRPRNGLPRYEAAIAVNPQDVEVQFGYGLALAGLGRMEDALAHFRAAVQLQPSHAGANLHLGFLLLQRHELEEAIGHFRISLASLPRSDTALLGLASALEQMGRTAEATTSFAQAMACAPDNPAVFSAWADTLARRGKFAEAVAPYERAVQLQPDDAGTRAGLGFVLYFSNRRAEAIRQWEEALRLNPSFPGLRERLEKIRQEQTP